VVRDGNSLSTTIPVASARTRISRHHPSDGIFERYRAIRGTASVRAAARIPQLIDDGRYLVLAGIFGFLRKCDWAREKGSVLTAIDVSA